MSAMNTLGFFSEPSYISIGDPYASSEGKSNGKSERLSRYYGKQFSFAPPKKGQTASDVYFDSFKRLYEGEKYVNPGKTETLAQLANNSGKIAGDWKPNNPPKKNSGKGNYYGTIGAKYEHKSDHDAGRGPKNKYEGSALPNVLTNPGKKGGFGVPGTTMGATFAYESEPYDLARREERESAAADNRKRIGPAFKAMSHGDKDFNTCDEFKDGGLAPDDPFHKIKSETFDRPFMPSAPAKSHKQLDTLSKFPEYKEDPIAAKVAEARQELAEKKAKMGPIFRPTSGPKSSRTRPVRFNG